MLSEKLTRKRSEVWLFTLTGRFDTLAFRAVTSFIFGRSQAWYFNTKLWACFFMCLLSIFRRTVNIVKTKGATSAEVYVVPLLHKMNCTWTHSETFPLPLFALQTGKVDPLQPRVSGHRGNVLDVKWNPFNDYIIASCSEDSTVRASPECFTHLRSFSLEYEHVAAGR